MPVDLAQLAFHLTVRIVVADLVFVNLELNTMQTLRIIIVACLLFSACKTKVTTSDNCGDAIVDPGESCDGEELAGQTCGTLGFYDDGAPLTCSADCSFNTTQCGSSCGDNVVDVAYNEECDSQQLSGNTCVSFGFVGGSLGCLADCKYDTTGCISVCGNGLVEPNEGCDDSNTAPADGCSELCEVEPGWTCAGVPSVCEIVECGDGVAAGDEPCDGPDLKGQTCEALGYYGGTLACSGACELDLASCEAAGSCGDGQFQAGFEACEGPNLGGATCESLGYHGGTGIVPVCTAECALDDSACAATGSCGDGQLQAGFEDCDGAVDVSDTCATQGLFSGSLSCNGACGFDTSLCIDAVRLTLGDKHACALDEAGHAYCWGEGLFGKLGDGAQNTSYLPVTVTMPGGVAFVSIHAGTSNTCALATDGTAWCWGHGSVGKNGNNDVSNKLVPSPVTMPANRTFVRLATGATHSCAIDDLGRAWCWGSGQYGKLGNGAWNDAMVPTAVTMPSGGITFSFITAGEGHTCAISQTGAAYCWGLNTNGQLGNNATSNSLIPTGVSASGVEFTVLHAGFHTTCGVASSGAGYCWGRNDVGQVGDGSTVEAHVPTAVSRPGGVSFMSVSVYGVHACATTTAGALYCWGGNDHGQLGRAGAESAIPVLVNLPPGALAVDTGLTFTCAITSPGRLWCWGYNDFGQLGGGTALGIGPFPTPIPVVSP